MNVSLSSPAASRKLFVVLVAFAAVAPLGCEKKLDGPQPAVSAVAPHAACNAQIETKVVITGDGFSPLNDRLLKGQDLELPQVTLIREKDLTGAVTTGPTVVVPDDLTAPDRSDVTWSSQGEMAFRVCPAGSCSKSTPAGTDYELDPGVYRIEVKNRSGRQSQLQSAIAIVPRPTLTSADNDLLCKDKSNRLLLTGDYLLRLDGKPLSIAIGGTSFVPELSDCRTLAAPEGLKLEACRTAAVNIPAQTFATGTYPIVATGPSPTSCRSTEALTLTLVPEPSVTAVQPDVACVAEMDRAFTVRGAAFLTVDGVLPTITVGATSYVATAAAACAPVTGPRAAVQSCAEVTFTVPRDGLPPESYDLTVRNPAPADCVSNPPVKLVIVPRPTLTTIEPELTCNEQAASVFTLTGMGFLEVDGVPPEITLTGPQGLTFTSVPSMVVPISAACAPVTGPVETVNTCTGLRLTVPQGALTASGSYQFTVTNPQPAGCSTSELKAVLVVPAPHLTAVAPAPACTVQGPLRLTLTGTGFLTLDGGAPSVRFVNQTSMATTSGDAGVLPGSCSPVDGGTGVESCSGLLVDVAQNAFTPGVTYAAFVDNPAPAACSTPEVVTFKGAAAPSISAISPLTLCTGGGQLRLTGVNFEADAGVTAGGQISSSVLVTDGGTVAVVTFGGGAPGGPFPVTLNNPSGCGAVAPQQITVVAGPILLFVEPNVAYNGMTTPITAFAANATPPFTRVEIVKSGSAPIQLAFTTPNRADRPVAVVPQNTPAGVYDLLLTDSTGCPAVLAGALTVVSATTLTLAGATPTFGWTGSRTDITVSATVGGGSTGFGPAPRVYLVPTATPTTSIALTAVDVVSSTSLTTVVPTGLTPGTYDVVVVNEDGTVGRLASAFTVSANPPPRITGITPSQVSTNVASQVLTIAGSNFRAGSPPPLPGVILRCIDPLGNPIAAQTATVTSFTATSISATISTTGPLNGNGANCIVEVTNTDDQTKGQFSSLVVVNPTINLTSFINGPNMAQPRQGLGAASGGAGESARFVYALAGDNGTTPSASVEVLPVDVFGKAGPAFFTQRNALLAARTQTSAVRIGRFIYVVGGASAVSNNTAALASVERAAILDTTTAPANLAVDIDIVPGTSGLSGGLYYYRVATVMDATDPFNAQGESLPSERFGLRLPNLANYSFSVKLTWSAVPRAASYRVYRTAANAAPGTETLLADTAAPPTGFTCSTPTATTCTDSGAVLTSSVTPLRLGSTGLFKTAATLGTARQAAGVTFAPDPADATRAYIYVFGGVSAAGATLSSYEFLPIVIQADGSQTVGAPVSGLTNTLTAPRQRLRAYTVKPTDSTRVGADTFVYMGGGSSLMPTTMVTNFDVARVGTGGVLDPITLIANMNPQMAGYGAFSAGDFLYGLGGEGGLPTVTSMNAELGPRPPPPPPPGVQGPPPFLNMQSFTPGMNVARVDLGAAIQSGYFYVLGGATAASPLVVTTSTEFVLY